MQFTKFTTVFSAARSRRLATTLLWGLGAVWAAGCAGSSVGESLQQSLAADPQLEEPGTLWGNASETGDEAGPRAAGETATEQETTSGATGSNRESTLPPPAERSRATAAENHGTIEDGPRATNQTNRAPSSGSLASRHRSALSDVPEDLKPYIEDLMGLNFFSRAEAQQGNDSASAIAFEPNQPITRGQYANWLLTANNLFYSDQPSKKIRPATASATPVFQDVPTAHPYFGAIQGLAEAGLIPNALTGNSTTVNFRPDAPLTRESLVLWKVPLDRRTALPSASVDAVKATWGFQDAADIEPLALRAVLADHQTGDFANILRAFGYTTLLQPQKAVTQAEAAATLWRFGTQTEGIAADELQARNRVE